jgi:hypothetical protein
VSGDTNACRTHVGIILSSLHANLFEQFMRDENPVGSVEIELVRKMAEHTCLRERAARYLEACFLVMQ